MSTSSARPGEPEITEEERAVLRERKAELERDRHQLDGRDRIEKIRLSLKQPNSPLKIRFLPAATRDIERAAKWYEAQSDGLGSRFITKVLEAADKIEANPLG